MGLLIGATTSTSKGDVAIVAQRVQNKASVLSGALTTCVPARAWPPADGRSRDSAHPLFSYVFASHSPSHPSLHSSFHPPKSQAHNNKTSPFLPFNGLRFLSTTCIHFPIFIQSSACTSRRLNYLPHQHSLHLDLASAIFFIARHPPFDPIGAYCPY